MRVGYCGNHPRGDLVHEQIDRCCCRHIELLVGCSRCYANGEVRRGGKNVAVVGGVVQMIDATWLLRKALVYWVSIEAFGPHTVLSLFGLSVVKWCR